MKGGCIPLLLLGWFLLSPIRAQDNASQAATPTNAPADLASPDTNTLQASAILPPRSQSAPSLNAPGSKEEEIDDIRPPFFFSHGWLWLWLALGLVGLIALLILLWNWFKPGAMINPRTAYELALEKLEKARTILQEENPMPYAILVSETVRSYLGQRFQTPSTRRTTEEFLRQMEDDQSTPLAEHRNLLRHFLQSCDLVKFARYQPTRAELEEAHQRAVNFVTATKPAPLPPHSNGRLP